MKSKWSRSVALALLLAVPTSPLPARAEDDAGVRESLNKINDHLARMKDALSGLGDNTSQSAVDKIREAMESARQLRSTAKELADKHPEQEPAKIAAERYPDYAERFLRSGQALLEMKRLHNNQAGWNLTNRCEEAERKLKEECNRYVEHNDPDGLQKLPELVEHLATPLIRELEEEERRKSEVSNLKSTARDFSESHERWADVRDKLRDGADAVFDRWMRAVEDEHHACDELAKGKQHREVEQALSRLGQSSDVRMQLLREMDESLERITGLLRELPERHDESGIATAIELGNKVSDSLGRLSSARGKDRKAEEIVNRWPGHVDRYLAAARALQRLKMFQYTLDHASAICSSYGAELLGLVAKSDRGAGRRARERSVKIYEDVLQKLGAADQTTQEVRSLRDEARRLSAEEGRWRAVSSAVGEAATRISEYWESALKRAHDSCQPLALGLKNPYLMQGMKFDNQTTDLMSQCTIPENDSLHDFQNEMCIRDRACKKDNLNCDDLKARMKKTEECRAARIDIREHCYYGGNDGHVKPVTDAETAIAKCQQQLVKANCPGF
jgi:hypothetical protein